MSNLAAEFLSTLSLRRATCKPKSQDTTGHNFYPRSPCGERPLDAKTHGGGFGISIHALLAESDVSCTASSKLAAIFLSTLSLRRATEKP